MQPSDTPGGTSSREPQCARAVLMVRPARFAFNPQTAPSNAFQVAEGPEAEQVPGRGQVPAPRDEPGVAWATGAAPLPLPDIASAALHEFDALANALERAGVAVIVAEDTASPVKPDAVFPNNWVSFHGDGTVVLYPMLAPNRRWERRDEVVSQVARAGYRIARTVDLSHREAHGQFLEGTGSLVLDRVARVAYAGLSPRTHLDALGEFAQLLDYDLVTFEAYDGSAQLIYHTNVLMAVGAGFAVVCGESIKDGAHRAAVLGKLRATGHEVIDISMSQMHRFGGNLLQLASASGNVIALSAGAWAGFDAGQRRRLENHGSIVASDIPLIERSGGGGVRCMLAEIHLPVR